MLELSNESSVSWTALPTILIKYLNNFPEWDPASRLDTLGLFFSLLDFFRVEHDRWNLKSWSWRSEIIEVWWLRWTASGVLKGKSRVDLVEWLDCLALHKDVFIPVFPSSQPVSPIRVDDGEKNQLQHNKRTVLALKLQLTLLVWLISTNWLKILD